MRNILASLDVESISELGETRRRVAELEADIITMAYLHSSRHQLKSTTTGTSINACPSSSAGSTLVGDMGHQRCLESAINAAGLKDGPTKFTFWHLLNDHKIGKLFQSTNWSKIIPSQRSLLAETQDGSESTSGIRGPRNSASNPAELSVEDIEAPPPESEEPDFQIPSIKTSGYVDDTGPVSNSSVFRSLEEFDSPLQSRDTAWAPLGSSAGNVSGSKHFCYSKPLLSNVGSPGEPKSSGNLLPYDGHILPRGTEFDWTQNSP